MITYIENKIFDKLGNLLSVCLAGIGVQMSWPIATKLGMSLNGQLV